MKRAIKPVTLLFLSSLLLCSCANANSAPIVSPNPDEKPEEDEPAETFYSININPNEYVDISFPELKELKAKKDEAVVFSLSLKNEETIVESVSVSYENDSGIQAVSVTHQNYTYGFYMPEADVSISVETSFKEYAVNIIPNEYVDIALDHNETNYRHAGDTVSFTVSSTDEYREVSKVTVRNDSGEIETSVRDGLYSFIMPNSSVIILAETELNAYHISTLNDEHVTYNLTNIKELYKEGETVSFTAIGKEGYSLSSVSISAADDTEVAFTVMESTYSFLMPKSDVVISFCVEKLYVIETETDNYCIVHMINPSDYYSSNSEISFTVEITDPNHQIGTVTVKTDNASVDYLLKDGVYSFTMPGADVTISADTISSLYQVSVTNNEHVTFNLIGQKQEFNEGDEVTFAANVEYGYLLNSVMIQTAAGEDVSYTKGQSPYSFIMPKSNVTISFEVEKLYRISLSPDSHSSVSVTDAKDYYQAGNEVSFKVEINDSDYELSEISIKANGQNVNYSSSGDGYLFTMPKGDVTIVVKTKVSSSVTAKDPFTSSTTFYGTWNYDDGYTLYYMGLEVTFNGNSTLSWKLTYDYDDDYDYYYSLAGKVMNRSGSNVSEKASQKNVAYTYNGEKDQINATLAVKTQQVAMTIQLVRTGTDVSSIYFTSNMSGDYYQCGNHRLYIQK